MGFREMDPVSSLTSEIVHKALDGLAKRHSAISSNLANVDTPGYRRKDVAFEDALKSVMASRNKGTQAASNAEQLPMRRTQPEHFAIGFSNDLSDIQPEMIEIADTEYRNDGNSVDVETEMVQLAKNTQRYAALAKFEGKYYEGLKSVIRESGG